MIPVFWISLYPDILARGYADQGGLEEIFAREMWTPPSPLEFEHHELREREWPDVDGAVVLLPCRHHINDVDWFVEQLDKLKWSLVILCGDEAWDFDWAKVVETPTRRVWIQQPRPEHAHLSGLIPGGPYPHTREGIVKAPRVHDIFFAGQVRDNTERIFAVKAIRQLDKRYSTLTHETNGYMQGWPRDQYLEELSRSKTVPSPSGPMTVDTARPLEALEAGCVPVCGTVTPRGEDYDYWRLIFNDHPIPTVREWKELRYVAPEILRDWQWWSNHCFSFWQQMKRKWSLQLDHDIKEVMSVVGVSEQPNEPLAQATLPGRRRESQDESPRIVGANPTPDDLITVCISTSPAPIHPSLDHITTVIDSVRERLPRAEILIACDGVRNEDLALRADYNQYLADLLWKSNFEWHNVLPVVMDRFLHQANSVKKVLSMVNTPYVLFLEHDTPLEGDIPFDDLTAAMSHPDVNTIRFHFDVELHSDHEPLHFGDIEDINGVPLRRIRVWWARPQLTKLSHFRYLLDKHFDEHSRTFIEDKVYGILHSDWVDNGPPAWNRWRIWTYMPEGNIKRSGHLDSRGEMVKHRMVF